MCTGKMDSLIKKSSYGRGKTTNLEKKAIRWLLYSGLRVMVAGYNQQARKLKSLKPSRLNVYRTGLPHKKNFHSGYYWCRKPAQARLLVILPPGSSLDNQSLLSSYQR